MDPGMLTFVGSSLQVLDSSNLGTQAASLTLFERQKAVSFVLCLYCSIACLRKLAAFLATSQLLLSLVSTVSLDESRSRWTIFGRFSLIDLT